MKQWSKWSIVIVMIATAKHLVWGVALLFYPDVERITAVVMLAHTFGYATPYVLLAVSVGVVISEFFTNLWPHVIFNAMQQFLLFVSAWGCVVAIQGGAYLDGTVVPRSHLVGDQDLYILFAVGHLIALLLAYGIPQTGRRMIQEKRSA